MTKNTQRQTSILNRLEGLDEEDQEYDHQLVQDLNSFAHNVYAVPPKMKKPPKKGARHKHVEHEAKEEYPKLKPSALVPGPGCGIPIINKSIFIRISKKLDEAILPLFTMSQFVQHLDIFKNLPYQIGARGEEGSLPPENGPRNISHRNVTGVCDDSNVNNTFSQIARNVKNDAGTYISFVEKRSRYPKT